MGVRWAGLSGGAGAALLRGLETRAGDMNRQHLATALFSLGGAGRLWSDLPPSLCTALAAALIPLWAPLNQLGRGDGGSDNCPAQSLSMTLVGLGSLGARRWDLPPSGAQGLLRAVCALSGDMNAAQLASALSGAAQLGWGWTDLDCAVPRALTGTLAQCSDAGGAALLSSLAALGARWRGLPADLQAAVVVAATRGAQTGSPEQVAAVAYSLGAMECVWELMPVRLGAALVAGIVRVAGSGAGERAMAPQSAANLMYAVSMLCFDVDAPAAHAALAPVYLALLRLIPAIGVGAFADKERSQILIFLQFLRHLTGVGDTAAHRYIVRVDERDDAHPMSRLQLSVVSALAEALTARSTPYRLQNEYSAFGGALPVDATVFREDRVVAFIEIDGPHHYSAAGLLRRKDALKEALYRKKHPGAAYCRVRHDQVRLLGERRVGERVADLVAIVDPGRAPCANRRAERDLSRALQGCLPLYSDDGY